MPVNTGDTIVYQDLVNMVLNTVYSKCQNIDSIDASVPNELRNGYSRRISSLLVVGCSRMKTSIGRFIVFAPTSLNITTS